MQEARLLLRQGSIINLLPKEGHKEMLRSRLAKLALVATCLVFAAPASSALAGWFTPNSLGATQPYAQYYPCQHQAEASANGPFGMGPANNIYVKPWLRDSVTGKWVTFSNWYVLGEGRSFTFNNVQRKPLSLGIEFKAYVNGRWTTPFYEPAELIQVTSSYTNLMCYYTSG